LECGHQGIKKILFNKTCSSVCHVATIGREGCTIDTAVQILQWFSVYHAKVYRGMEALDRCL